MGLVGDGWTGIVSGWERDNGEEENNLWKLSLAGEGG